MEIFAWALTAFSIVAAILGTICSIALPLLVIGGLVYFLYKRSQQRVAYRQAAQAWRSAEGKILMSSVQRTHQGNSYPVVVYQYEVNGNQYQSQTIQAGEQFLNAHIVGQAQETVQRYPIGKTVTVYYNPDNPAESALER